MTSKATIAQLAILLIGTLVSNLAAAQETDTDTLAKAAQNPISSLISVPFGLGVGQITKFGKQPVNLQASFYYNVERPELAPRYQLRLQVQLMFPK